MFVVIVVVVVDEPRLEPLDTLLEFVAATQTGPPSEYNGEGDDKLAVELDGEVIVVCSVVFVEFGACCVCSFGELFVCI